MSSPDVRGPHPATLGSRLTPMREVGILQLVESIYRAALDPTHWDFFAEDLSEVLGGAAVCLSLQLPGFTTPPLMYVYGFDAAYEGTLMAHLRDGLPWEEARRNDWVGRFGCASNTVSDEELGASALYRECMKPQGIAVTAPIGHTIALEGGEPLATLVAFAREGSRPLDDTDLELGNQLVPHLARAYEIHRKMWEIAALARTQDRIPTGLVMLDALGRPIHANASARRISKLADGLAIETSGLRVNAPDEQEQLDLAVEAALRPGASTENRAFGTLTVQRPSGLRPFALTVRPLLEDRPESTLHDARAVLYISDLEFSSRREVQALRVRYGLTRAEGELVSLLCEGLSLESVATRRKVSIHTVRSQLKQVFAKTSTSRQSELVGHVLVDLPPTLEF